MKYCGIDLHSNDSVVVVSDEGDRIVLQKRLPNDLGQIQAALEPHREDLTGVVIESTYNWYWLVEGLMDASYQVHLAHPSAIKKNEGAEIQRGLRRRGVSGAAAAPGVIAGRLHLSARGAWGTRSGAQAPTARALPHRAEGM